MYSVLNENIQYIKGVGPKKAEKMSKLGIKTIKDALYYFPRQFEDRSREKKIFQLEDSEKVKVKVRINNIVNLKANKLTITRFEVSDETGKASLIFFNRAYLRNTFRVGDIVRVFGTVKIEGNSKVEMHNCEIEYEKTEKNTGIIVPVYSLTYGVSNKDVMGVIRNVFENSDVRIKEYLPKELISKYSMCDINFAIKSMHFPIRKEDLKVAMFRLIFEEFLFMQLGLFSIKGGNSTVRGIEFEHRSKLDEIEDSLPFRLTKAQKRALNEIIDDMKSPKVMNRLVQGDVGSGKTVVAQLALANAVLNGYQGAYMAPTEILAKQHYESFTEFFRDKDIKVEILTGSTRKKEGQEILERLSAGDIDILIGTHALIEDRVEFKKLGLVITDEQHRFGVRQRGKLNSKSENPDVMVMTATPIPRTLALILYGDLDISIIDELPPGRKAIETIAIEKNKRKKYYMSSVRSEIEKGRQAYIVCPLVEESEVLEVQSATEVYEELANEMFPDLRVGLLHGKMKAKEKDEIMEAFKNHELDILVSTTVIEVGVNVPNATLMIVENAERFGLSQLHQLRGRVGRGSEKSYCTLIYDSKTKVCKQRMDIMEETNDGFKISEKDLEIRGPGDFFGTRQHGLPELKVANLFKHMKILRMVQKEAREIYSKDPALELKENQGIKYKIEEMFKSIGENISL
ncbi:ATP-dependent DNA helicase RecG [Peptostreptococcus russellii]|uniref:ATP-dependent DNA helicase RecG n=1 Tax=Peptostreptococcus russellii TaxID=215200 RepID=A0A1H8FGX8_9FIRM|nr:ATP-dependent DNA helicase RecG [Peptostreptococcus russellii]SEN30882.1 ATP-dependent DNA helicase RecG [Peptostreptococcus russellii]